VPTVYERFLAYFPDPFSVFLKLSLVLPIKALSAFVLKADLGWTGEWTQWMI
jgi:hypothetical protein